jgi:hypothetical protein
MPRFLSRVIIATIVVPVDITRESWFDSISKIDLLPAIFASKA